MMNDEDILKWYMKGFHDELYGTTSAIDDDILLSAYKLGSLHAIIGDDVRDVDYLTKDEILKMIKNKNE